MSKTDMLPNNIEHRDLTRYRISGCMVRYQRDIPFRFLAGLSKKHPVINISQGGIQFISK